MSIKEIDNKKYERICVKTHMIHIKEEFDPLLEKYVTPLFEEGDRIAISEKVVTISQGRVVHESVIQPGRLAKLVVKGVTKHKDDIGYSHPRKMEVAIMQAGRRRVFFAMILG